MLWEILIIGSFWWWLMSFVAFCLLVAFIENEKGTVATFTVVLGIAIVQLFSDFNVVSWMWKNPMWIGIGAGGYIVIGAGWGTIKWILFARDKREKYDEAKEEWLLPENLKHYAKGLRRDGNLETRHSQSESQQRKAQLDRWANALDDAAAAGGGELTDALKPAWTAWRANLRCDQKDVKPIEVPHPRDQKARIMRWIGHWPWSMFWTLLNDPIRAIAKAVYKRMTVIYVSIGQRAFRGVEDDFVIEDENE